jgi:dTDP-glucose 4,6-dehydratase
MRILVAGGAGFIGSHYVRTLMGGGYPGFTDARVTVLDKLTYAGNVANLQAVASHPRFTFIRGDICDAALVGAVAQDHDIVLNFAAETHVDRFISGASDFVAANVAGVQVLLQACLEAGVRRVVQVSTDEVYGSVARGSWSEDAPLAPNSPYAAAKAGGDLMARAYFRTHGLDVIITRCVNNYGPYQFPEKVIPLFTARALDDQPLPLYASTQNRREWLHVDDHCRAVELVLQHGEVGETYNVGSGIEASIEEIADAVLAATGKPPSLKEIVPDRPSHDRRYLLDSSKIRRTLGWEPTVPFTEGLAATVAWYGAHRAWWEPLCDRAPIVEGDWSPPGGTTTPPTKP